MNRYIYRDEFEIGVKYNLKYLGDKDFICNDIYIYKGTRISNVGNTLYCFSSVQGVCNIELLFNEFELYSVL